MRFTHPNLEVRVIDNSFIEIIGDGGGTALFAPIFSSKGRDNVVREYTESQNFVYDYGEPNMAKYGQQNYNVIDWLNAKGRAYVLRLLPADARFANLMVSAKLSEENGKKAVSFRSVSKDSGVSSVGAITASFENAPEGEVPLFAVIPYGRGSGYNGIGVKFDLTKDFDKTYNFRTYNVRVYEKDVTGADVLVEGPFRVSFYKGAKSTSQESLYFADVLNKYSKKVRIIDNADAFEKITTHVLGDDTTTDPRLVDILAGIPADTETPQTPLENAVWMSSALEAGTEGHDADAADFNRIHFLENGFDGVIDDTVKEKLLADAFNGLVDKEVYDIEQYNFDVVLDANYSKAIKYRAAQFVQSREDCMFFADCNFQGDVEQTINFRKEQFTVSSYLVAIFAQHGEIFDTYGGGPIKVTSTYLLASKVPEIDRTQGVHWTFVGPRRGIVSGIEKINFFPTEQEKENLYQQKINYIERDPRKTNFGSQLTSQVKNSALSDISHVRTLLKIRRACSLICKDYRMEFNDASTHQALSYELNSYLAQWVGNRACTECSATVSATEYEKLQRIARVTISIKFTGILERIQLDLVVGR